MTRVEKAMLEYYLALEGDGPKEEVNAAKDKLAEIAVLWAQGYYIKQTEEKERVKKFAEELRQGASKVFPGCEFLPFDDIPTIPVYGDNGHRGIVLDQNIPEDGNDICRGWWKVKFDHMPNDIVLEYPPRLTTTPPSPKK